MAKRIEWFSRAAMLGFAWGSCWIPLGVVGGRVLSGEVDPPHIGGPLYAGFASGFVFAALSGFASGRRLDGMPVAFATLRGALTGLIVGLMPFALGDANRDALTVPVWLFWSAVVGAMILICTVTAPICVWLARILRSEPSPNTA